MKFFFNCWMKTADGTAFCGYSLCLLLVQVRLQWLYWHQAITLLAADHFTLLTPSRCTFSSKLLP